ncbi:MAG: radical SAM protein [Ezakiella sp.]|nr:radical SAM protein [Ezakiella sp.]MDD7471365.1 radical SAM protein [Bacillota bacterium]MDY3923540.1 radical SAM protein [Ezakiella sp.]
MICNICPRKCNVDRDKKLGICGVPNDFAISKAMLHFWEEPSVSGKSGSGTIFFAGCNMRCVFCQNFEISQERGNNYEIVNEEKLADIMIGLENKGANNINLVSPMHYAHKIPTLVDLARKKGLTIPIVYNTNSYELVETLQNLNGKVDVYLADIKYCDDELSKKYSKTKEYFDVAFEAIKEMYYQVGKTEFEDGLLKRGVLVRILVLPTHVLDAKRIIKKLYNEFGNNISYSLMNQYCPLYKATEYPEINRDLTVKEYNRIVDYAMNLGIENGFIQAEKMRENGKKSIYTPDFDLGGIE